MHPVLRILGIAAAFCTAAVAWLILAGVTSSRTSEQQGSLYGRVSDLWGSPQVQVAPTFVLEWTEMVDTTEEVRGFDGIVNVVRKSVPRLMTEAVDPASSRLDVGLHLDQRRKGLLWFPLYDVDFGGAWTYSHAGPSRDLRITFRFPEEQGVYDDFRFVVDGVDRAGEARPSGGVVQWVVPMVEGRPLAVDVGYRSRGMSEWSYRPSQGVGQVEDFALVMRTDFEAIDFPAQTMSPSSRARDGSGWKLDWTFSRLVSGFGIGMVMPERIQPGELASEMALTAALPLGLFFLWLYVLGLLRGVEIHPINYVFISAAFFAFNLLFSYTADRLPVEWAFAVASLVSVGLVVSYLRLVVGPRFAFLEAGMAQVLYQIGFSAAHFFEGFTGLTITVLGVVTLFALMQLTGRINWSERLAGRPPHPA